MTPSLIENPQAISAIYELLDLDCTVEEVRESYENFKIRFKKSI